MKLKVVLVLAVVWVACATSLCKANLTQWSVNGHYYDVVELQYTSWGEAKTLAESSGGYLATITSEAENDFIYDNFLDCDKNPLSKYYWIGLYQDPYPGGPWKWVTGETFNYSNWSSTEPSGDGGVVHIYSCLEEHSYLHGKWNDESAATARLEYGSYIIEYDTNPIPAPGAVILGGIGIGLVSFLRKRKTI